jgi:hypothetical protein
MKTNRLVLPVSVMLVMLSSAAAAEVYRCTDPATKKVTYSGTPCAAGEVRRVPITDNVVDGSEAQEELARRRIEQQRLARRRSPSYDNDVRATATTMGQNSADSEYRARLANECSNGFKRSCSTLRTLNVGQSAQASSSPEAKRLAEECNRGLKKSCAALRALNGEQPHTKTVCNTSGISSGYAQRIGDNMAVGNGAYSGRTVCRDRPDE